jgi:hypothetical protein
MYTVVPKQPKGDIDKDPYPLLDMKINWGLTDEEFKLKYAGGKWAKKRKRIELLQAIIDELREET